MVIAGGKLSIKASYHFEERGKRGGSLRASAYCQGAKCFMTI